MSVRTMARVWAQSKHSGTHLLMLLAIADFADDAGNAYPAVPTLAMKCRMKPRNANFILAALRASGELEVRQNEGPKGTNRYRITLPEGVQGLAGVGVQTPTGVQELAGVQRLAAPPAKACPKPLQGIADEPSLNHQEPSGDARERAHTKPSHEAKHFPDVDAQLVADWNAARKGKRAGPITATVARILRRQAAAAGISPSDAIEFCIGASWQNFNAQWYRERSEGANAAAARGGRRPVLDADDVFVGAR